MPHNFKSRTLGLGLSLLLLTFTAPASGLSPTKSSQTQRGPQQQPRLIIKGSVPPPSSELIAAWATKEPVMEESSLGGVLSLIGGIMIHLTCGSMYCWGNLISYLPAGLRYWSPEGGSGPADAQLVLAFILMSQMTGMPFGPVLESLLGPRLTAVVGSLMMGSGVFLASYAKSLVEFVLCYSVLFGLGVGVAYQMPFITGGRWFPSKKGTVQGAIISGMGASAFLFNIIATNFINPVQASRATLHCGPTALHTSPRTPRRHAPSFSLSLSLSPPSV